MFLGKRPALGPIPNLPPAPVSGAEKGPLWKPLSYPSVELSDSQRLRPRLRQNKNGGGFLKLDNTASSGVKSEETKSLTKKRRGG